MRRSFFRRNIKLYITFVILFEIVFFLKLQNFRMVFLSRVLTKIRMLIIVSNGIHFFKLLTGLKCTLGCCSRVASDNYGRIQGIVVSPANSTVEGMAQSLVNGVFRQFSRWLFHEKYASGKKFELT